MENSLEVEGINCNVLMRFDVLWLGWECDPVGWIVKSENTVRVVFTSHGCPKFVEPSELQERIDYYKSVLEESERALNLVLGK